MQETPDAGSSPSARSRILRVDVLSGIVLVLVGSTAWLGAASLDAGTFRYFGPGMLPKSLSSALVAIGMAILVVGFRQTQPQAELFRASLRGPCAIAAALLVFAATVRGVDMGAIGIAQLGLVVAGPLAVIIAGYASPEANFRDLCALALGLTAGCMAVFNDALGMTMPVLPKSLEAAAASSIGGPMAMRAAYVGYAVVAILIVVLFPRAGAPGGQEGQKRE